MSTEIVEDFLEVDQPIPGQNYVCLSFISPEKVVKQKEVFFMKKFLQDLLTDENKRKYLLNMDLEKLTYEKVNDMVEDFRISKEKEVNDEFDVMVDYQCSTRGIKVRGVYDSIKECRIRAAILQKRDPNFNVFIGQIGYWLPFDPANTDNIDAEYQEGQLNELMKNYKINAEQRDMFYQDDKQAKVDAAIKENLRKKQEAAQKGELNLSKDPLGDKREKLAEFRDILDEKDRAFNEVVKQNGENSSAGGTTSAMIASDEFSSGNHADPWMQRKAEGEETLSVPSGNVESMSHSSNDVTGDGLKEIAKNIF
jgi:hypothetical protein